MGITVASFNWYGNSPSNNDILIIYVNGLIYDGIHFFPKDAGISSHPAALFFKFKIIWVISYSDTVGITIEFIALSTYNNGLILQVICLANSGPILTKKLLNSVAITVLSLKILPWILKVIH